MKMYPTPDLKGLNFFILSQHDCSPVCLPSDMIAFANKINEVGGVVRLLNLPQEVMKSHALELRKYFGLMHSVLHGGHPYSELMQYVVVISDSMLSQAPVLPSESAVEAFCPIIAVDGVPFETICRRSPVAAPIL